MESVRPSSPVASLLAERFDDFFEKGSYPATALGVMLTWIWMGLTEGYPIFIEGRVDLLSVMIVLGSFAAAMIGMGFLQRLWKAIEKPKMWIIGGVVVGAVCLLLLYLCFEKRASNEVFQIATIRASMILIGGASAVLIMMCATGFACMRPVSAGIGFAFAIVVTFVVFFCLNVCSPLVRGGLFCCLPLVAALALYRGREGIIERMALTPREKLPFARGFTSMVISFGVFFFAIGAKCALEPVSEFATAADTSVIGILLVSLAFLYAIGLRKKTVGVFRALKVSYSVAVIVLTVCIAIAPLSVEPYAGIVYNADVMVMIMVLWLLTAFVANFNETPVGQVIGVALGVAAIGLAIGWATGTALYQLLGHDRSYPTIGIACATAVFSTMGFSGKSFPHLTHRGEGAKKVAKVVEPYKPEIYGHDVARDFGLSEREREVLELMVTGYGADAISEKLVVSYHTARTHIRNIYKKMDIHSQRDLLDDYEASKEHYEESGGDK